MPEHSRIRFALQASPNHEAAVTSRLQSFGIKSFPPKYVVRRNNKPSALTPQTYSLDVSFPCSNYRQPQSSITLQSSSEFLVRRGDQPQLRTRKSNRLKILVGAGLAAEMRPYRREQEPRMIASTAVAVTVPSKWVNTAQSEAMKALRAS